VGERPGGKPLSLWVATAGSTKYASLDADIDVDVAVIEAARVGTGVTGHTTGKVTSLHRLAYTELAGSHGEAAAHTYGQANEAAIEHIARMSGALSGRGMSSWPRMCRSATAGVSRPAVIRIAPTSPPAAWPPGKGSMTRSVTPRSSALTSQMRSILTVDVDGARYVLTGGEGHRASDVGDAAERYGRLAAFARDRLPAAERRRSAAPPRPG
jgi:hypothetical protein